MNLTRPQIVLKLLGVFTGIAIITLAGLLPAFATSGIQTVSLAPTDLIATPVSTSQIFLNWNTPVNATQSEVTGYQIQRNGTVLVNNTISLTTSFTDGGLLPNHQEQYSIASWNTIGLSPFSNVAIVSTLNPITTNPVTTSNPPNIPTSPGNNETSTIHHHGHKASISLKDHRNGNSGSSQFANGQGNYTSTQSGNQAYQTHNQDRIFSKLSIKSHIRSSDFKQISQTHNNNKGFGKLVQTHNNNKGFGKLVQTHIHGNQSRTNN